MDRRDALKSIGLGSAAIPAGRLLSIPWEMETSRSTGTTFKIDVKSATIVTRTGGVLAVKTGEPVEL